MAVVVLAENEVSHFAVLGDHGQGIELVIPDDVVALGQGRALIGVDQLIERGHEALDLLVLIHTADAVVTAGDDAEELAVGLTALGDSQCAVTGALGQLDDVRQSSVGADIAVALDKARLIALGSFDHRRFVLNALGAVDEAHAALCREGYGELVAGYRLHDRGYERDIHGDRALFTLPVLDERGSQGDVSGYALRGGVTRDEQIFIKSMGRFIDKSCHL